MSQRDVNLMLYLLIPLVVMLTGGIIIEHLHIMAKVPVERAIAGESIVKEVNGTIKLSELVVIKGSGLKAPSPWKISAEVPSDEILIQAPVSQSKDQLMGTLSGKGCISAIAVVVVNHQQQSFRCGDSLNEKKIKIVKIFRDVVVINNNGYYETLHVKE